MKGIACRRDSNLSMLERSRARSMFGDEKRHSFYTAWVQALHISLASPFLPIRAYLLRVHVSGCREERSSEGNSFGCEAPVKVPSFLSGRL
jgi:hypothetical protein